ncbi:hypothetical protein [Rhizobium terrae]|uniref:hypothetical protein n=1 Tax=Rhizobium terrae TaxID=2171756 RepID=UPI000E3EA602|nr:hypothetical protein [Rhizobium terrae]
MCGIRAAEFVQEPEPSFQTAAGRAKIALWSRGRAVILIMDGREYEFRFGATLTEADALALLSEHAVPVVREDLARTVVFSIAAVCLLALIFLYLLA